MSRQYFIIKAVLLLQTSHKMKPLRWIISGLALNLCINSYNQNAVTVTIDITQDQHLISPYIYGRNNSLSDSPGNPMTLAEWKMLRDAGVTIFRENGGNNSTKYNWRKKLSSHPDWYNNVYAHDWDFAEQSLQQNIPSAQGMWAFQLIGRVASSNQHNFNDWNYNRSQWWDGVYQNLAGGGEVNSSGGSVAKTEGDYTLYTQPWPADSTTAILDHWFGENGLGLDESKVLYWNMDNEAEIWSGTHDDIMPAQISAADFMQLYFAVAKKAREKFPDIKLVGPVPCNEWQWYNYDNNIISYGGENLCWLEYFIRRVAEEQTATGIRLLDVLDLHYYPGTSTAADLVQYHRVFFDKDYIYPEANGVKRVTGGWDNSITREYIFERCNAWLEEYMGANHGVTLGVSEIGVRDINSNVTAVWYASTLGEFMKHNVELFTPWSWQEGMWEVLHLFSRYNKLKSVKALSSQELYVSAYPSINTSQDSLTVILVNRSTTSSKSVSVTLSNFIPDGGQHEELQISDLPSTETFISHNQNGLKKGMISMAGNSFSITLPALSVTSVILSGRPGQVPLGENERSGCMQFDIFPNPVSDTKNIIINTTVNGPVTFTLFDGRGNYIQEIPAGTMNNEPVTLNLSDFNLSPGVYYLKMTTGSQSATGKLIITSPARN